MAESPPPAPGDADQERGALLSALLLLAEAGGVEAEAVEASGALESAMRARPGPAGERWNDWLVEAATTLGAHLSVVHVPLAEIVAAVGPSAPVLVQGGAGALVALTDRKGARVRVHFVHDPASDRWVRVGRLAQLLNLTAGAVVTAIVAEPLSPAASPHQPMSPEKRLWRLLRLEARDIWVLVAYALGIGLLSLAVPVAVQWLVNTIAFGTVLQPILVLALLVLIGLGVAAVLQALQEYVVEIIQRRVFVRVGADLALRLPRAHTQAFEAAHGPELVNRFFDVLTVQKSAATLLLDGLSIVLQTSVGLLVLAFYHPVFLAFDVFLALMLGVVVFWVLGRGGTKTSILESKSKYRVAAWLEEIARHPVSFKSRSGQQFAYRRADALMRDYLGNRKKHFRVVLRQLGGALALQAIASALLLGLGGWLVIRKELTLGQLVAAELIVAKVVADFGKTGKYLQTYYDLVAAIEKLGQLLDLPMERTTGEGWQPEVRPAAISLRDVSFGFAGRPPVLADVDLAVRPGEHLVLLGANGSGKSLLLDLVYGLRTPQRGTVEIDDHDVRDLSLSALRKDVALVRGVEIFEGSIADNVLMGRAELARDDVRRALGQVGLLEEVSGLRDGLDAVLATGGAPLSPGQAKRLVLARAMVGRPRLLLIDEALDGVDLHAREAILDSLFASDAPWTLIKVTQKRSTVERCDRVLELYEGRLRVVAPDVTPSPMTPPLTPQEAT